MSLPKNKNSKICPKFLQPKNKSQHASPVKFSNTTFNTLKPHLA